MFKNNDKYRVPKYIEEELYDALEQLDGAYRLYNRQVCKGRDFERTAEQRVFRAKVDLDKALKNWRWGYEAGNRRAARDGRL